MKMILPLFIAATTLTGCATLNIENRDAPKCSGTERRPLNADLWDWDSEEATQAGIGRVGYAPELHPKSLVPFEALLQAASTTQNDTKQAPTRWNVAASAENCGNNHG